MKKFTSVALFLLGLFEIATGLLFSPLRIYAAEPALRQKLGLSSLSLEQQRIYYDYMSQFRQQWLIVAVFGLLTIAASIILGRRARERETPAAC